MATQFPRLTPRLGVAIENWPLGRLLAGVAALQLLLLLPVAQYRLIDLDEGFYLIAASLSCKAGSPTQTLFTCRRRSYPMFTVCG